MRASQEIFRVRRQYNKWVRDETLEDYALRFTATKARYRTIDKVAKTALGATAFLALEAISAAVTLNYGFENTVWAMLAVSVIIFITGFPIAYYAAKYGLDIDLLTRSAGFGYLGSTITSLIYASFTFIFFAVEAAILASALESLFGIPPAIGYLLCAVTVIPIVTHGIHTISKFQVGTQHLWLFLQIVAMVLVIMYEVNKIEDWTQYTPVDKPEGIAFNLTLFGGASAIFFAFMAQVGEQVDYLRFMPEKTRKNRFKWWFWLAFAGSGWIIIGVVKMLFGSFLAYLALTQGVGFEKATDPMHMYQTAFSYLSDSPLVALTLAGTMIIISQMKINVTNAYAGSIAWSNFFSRLTHSHPGRVVWLVFNVGIALVLMELGIYRALESILGAFSIVAISWLSCLSADLMINKPLGLSPAQGEFKRAHLYDINPVGVCSMGIASIFGILCYLGIFGDIAKSLAHYFTIASCFLLVPFIAFITKGRFYLARQSPELLLNTQETAECCICQNPFEMPDMSHCPAYQGPICSLCCSLDARCMDMCKPKDAQLTQQLQKFLGIFLPRQLLTLFKPYLGLFITIFTAVGLVSLGLLSLMYFHIRPETAVEQALLYDTMGTLYIILMIILGVMSWLFLLAHESRKVAQQESNQQTKRLIEEIEAHKLTDRSLQEAKEVAERASSAKSRYLTGISHELRTPLQSILGYAQLLSQRSNINTEQKKGLNIIHRNGEYLTNLIEGLLDISKIEAGRLEIYRNTVKLPDFLDQVVQMFIPVAETNNIQFHYKRSPSIPNFVIADEKRLRQILINLISNAIKFTPQGSVTLTIEYRNQVAVFSVQDTGIGIDEKNLNRILDPFERVYNHQLNYVPGTGLGLTIVKLLTDIMGGDLRIESTPNQGSLFTVSLMLSSVEPPKEALKQPLAAVGYQGERRHILVVDDDPIHRELLYDILQPLGFTVWKALDAEDCLTALDKVQPDLYFLDFSMPGMSGLQLAKTLRHRGVSAPIIILSASAEEHHRTPNDLSDHDDYMVKPMNNSLLLEKISKFLHIDWIYQDNDSPYVPVKPVPLEYATLQSDALLEFPNHPLLRELLSYAEMGYTKGVNSTLNKVIEDNFLDMEQIQALQSLAEKFHYPQLITLLKPVSKDDE